MDPIGNETACFKEELVDADDTPYGLLLSTIENNFIEMSLQLEEGWTFEQTYITFLDCANPILPEVTNGYVKPGEFEISSVHKGEKIVNYYFDLNDLSSKYCYASYAMISHAKFGKKGVWIGDWEDFVEVDLLDCPDYEGLEELELCFENENIEFFIPLSEDASGDYPHAGSMSDSVAVTPENPTSTGYVYMDLVFDGIQNQVKDIVLTMEFEDLDLHHDLIQAGGNVAFFHESLTILDDQNNIISALTDEVPMDGEFEYSMPIPGHLIVDGQIKLKLLFTSTIDLMEGNGLQVSNTSEAIQNISLCGVKIEK